MRQVYRPIVRTMEEEETSKNKLSLDPTSTENQVTREITEVLTGMNENKDEPKKQMPPSIMETEVETVLLEEDGKLTEQILVQHQDGKKFPVTCPNGEDLESEDGKMRQEGTTIPERQKKKKFVMLSE
ncbi:Hypothetical predicted protein, partial [Olea europaea subsp. europaea]